MHEQPVACNQCGSEVMVLRREGQMFAVPGQDAGHVTLVISCPKCGQLEQPAVPRDPPPPSNR